MFRMERVGDAPHASGPLPPVRKVMLHLACEQYISLLLTAAKLRGCDLRRAGGFWQPRLPRHQVAVLPARSMPLVPPLCRAMSLHGQVMFKETNERNDTAQNTGVRKYIARCLSWGSCKWGLSYYTFQRGCLCHHQARRSPCI